MKKINYDVNSCDGKYKTSLDVRFCKACDNDCSFCIEKNGLSSAGKPDVDKLVESTIKSGKEVVLILGGEPFLYYDSLLEYIQRIRPIIKEIYITTSLPEIDVHKYIDVIRLVDGINISIHHYNNEINNNILNASNRFNRIKLLKNILANSQEARKKVRVCTVLTKEYWNETGELRTLFDAMIDLGVEHIKISEVQNASDYYISIKDIDNTNLHLNYKHNDGNNKWNEPYSFGCQTEHLYQNSNRQLNVTVKRCCFLVEKTQSANICSIIKGLRQKPSYDNNDTSVLYENGNLYNSWKHLTPKGGD